MIDIIEGHLNELFNREEDLSKGILSTHLHSEGQHAEELALIAPGMGKRWVTDIIAENNPDDESYFPYMNGSLYLKMLLFVSVKLSMKDCRQMVCKYLISIC